MGTDTIVGNDPSARRVTELENAFRALAGSHAGLSVDIVGRVSGAEALVHPTAGFRARLRDAARHAGVELYISASYAELTRWQGPEPGGPGAVRERFHVDLEFGFEWGDGEFPDAAALAHDLLAYMQYNLDALLG